MTMPYEPGTTWSPTPGSTGSRTAAPPATAPLPKTPPRTGIGSAAELRAERDRVQKQLDEAHQSAIDPTTGEFDPTGNPDAARLIASLNTRLTSLTEAITKAEAPKDKPPATMRGTAGPTDPFVVIDNGDGTITASANPNYTGQVQPQVVSHGNHTFVIQPPTPQQLAADPTAKPSVTVAYTDTDAQQLADRQTTVAELNAKTAAAAQAATAAAQSAASQIADRVSKGEDAASVRAEVQQQLEQAHQAWVEADGDRRAAQLSLDSYNTNRHATAQEQLSRDQLAQTAAAQARQDETARYGYDKSAASSKYATDAATQTARLNAANSFIQHSLTTLAEINKTLPPGSDLAGKALEGMLAYGQKFLAGSAGAQPAASPTDTILPDQPLPGSTNGAAYNPSDIQWNQPPGGSPDATNAPPPPAPPTLPNGVTPGPSGGLDWLFGSPGSPVANPANAAPVMPAAPPDAGAALAAQNAAAHARAMAAPVNLAPDGSPWASPQDVLKAFGRTAA